MGNIKVVNCQANIETQNAVGLISITGSTTDIATNVKRTDRQKYKIDPLPVGGTSPTADFKWL